MKTMNPMNLRYFQLWLFTLVLAIVQATKSHAEQPPFLTNGLVAYYPFNGNANDASGYGNDGIVAGATLSTDRFGALSNAYSFESLGQRITTTHANGFPLHTDDFAVSFWVNVSSDSGTHQIFLCNGVDQQFQIHMGPLQGGQTQIGFQTGGTGAAYTPAIPWLLHNWYNIQVVRYQGTNISIYRDGVQLSKQTSTLGNAALAGQQILTFGYNSNAPDVQRQFYGSMDDIRIYNRSLSDSELSALYSYESTPPDNSYVTNGLIAYYPLNGDAMDASGTGSNSGIGNSGVNEGASFVADRWGKTNSAAYFNGLSDIQVPNNNSLNPSMLTVSAWVKKDANSGDVESVVSHNGTEITAKGWALQYVAASGIEFDAGDDLIVYSTPNYQHWEHYIMVYDGFREVVYLNGNRIQESTSHTFQALSFVPGALFLGRHSENVPEGGLANFAGYLDDVRIYNRSLSAGEVKALHVYESTPPDNSFITNGLVAYYSFNGDAKDESKNGNDGNILNGNFTNDRFGNSAHAFQRQSRIGWDWGVDTTIADPLAADETLSCWYRCSTNVDTILITHGVPGFIDPFISITDGLLVFRASAPNNSLSWANTAVTDNQWHSVVATISGTSDAMYFDGLLVAAGRNADPSSGGTWKLATGIGSFDDVRIYNRALSDGEVKALYDYESTVPDDGPRTANAIAIVVNGFIVGATITDGGSGYTNAPNIQFVDTTGTGATAIATISNGSVTGISIITTGHGYTSTPTVVIDAPPYPPTQAKATATIVNGFVTGVSIIDSGHGYGTNAPPVHFLGGGGTGATGYASVSNGVVTGITITSTGSSYTNAPRVLIAVPPGVPSLSIHASQVQVDLSLLVGYTYKIQSTVDGGSTWTDTGPSFLATDSKVSQVFEVTENSQFFRVIQVQ